MVVTKSCPTLVTPWTVAHQAPLSMGSSRQEYWNGLPCSSPGDILTQGLNLYLLYCRWFPALQADSLPTEPPGKPQGSLGGYVIEISSHSPEKLTLVNKRGPTKSPVGKDALDGLGSTDTEKEK